ncbi:ABC transporter permease [Eremococcus coleocola]|uniref:Branched-chain amino acid ABC transporter, permease protein n=1 Tax=Eremococcus coleocola ACS-139-V-Col8 TaxID=908337 RepID=E4KQ14_9LACT|nr:branched-chain amino acid ABC transporter permease [Eremococcus coleocola]EFR31052.1 branched-chain amino acid ABC transporter, permease protein [Eremococcus coleocola ACS-139-V-Col8]
MTIYFSALIQGILWGIMGMGLYISFRILRFTDLTSEASFTIGAAASVMFASQGMHPILVLVVSILFGMLAGLVTGLLTTLFDIPDLLASIITMTGLYSVNLRIMGRPNASYRGSETIYSLIASWIEDINYQRLFIGLLISLILILALQFFFRTDLGQAMIATGDNPKMAQSIGIKTKSMTCLALMIANGLIALAGALISQDNSFTDISMGTGTVVIALASIVIGELLLSKQVTLFVRLISIVLGAIIYRLILVFVLQLGLNPNDFKLISALVLAVFLALPKFRYFLPHSLQRKGQA